MAGWMTLCILAMTLALAQGVFVTNLRFNKRLSNTYVVAAMVYQLLLALLLAAFTLFMEDWKWL